MNKETPQTPDHLQTLAAAIKAKGSTFRMVK